MGIALWTVCGIAAAIAASFLRFGPRRRVLEAVVALATALLLGLIATALDFGGWNEPDWRAGVFVFLGAFAAAGAVRAIGPSSAKPASSQ